MVMTTSSPFKWDLSPKPLTEADFHAWILSFRTSGLPPTKRQQLPKPKAPSPTKAQHEVGGRLPTAHILLPALKLKEPGWRWQWVPGLRTYKECKESPLWVPSYPDKDGFPERFRPGLPPILWQSQAPACSVLHSNWASNKSNWQLLSPAPLEAAVSLRSRRTTSNTLLLVNLGFLPTLSGSAEGLQLSSPHWSILTVTFTAFPCYSARLGTGCKLPRSLVSYNSVRNAVIQKLYDSENNFCHASVLHTKKARELRACPFWVGLFNQSV